MSCVRRLWNERGALSHRLTRTYALLFAATTLCLSLCVYFVSRQYLIERQRDDLERSARNIAEVFQREVAEGHDAADPAVLWELNSDENVALALIGLLAALNIADAVVALIAGRITAGRMLAPLSEMISRAQAIDAHALDMRLALPPADDELRQLAQTLNAMLDRVQAAFVRQGQFTQDASHEPAHAAGSAAGQRGAAGSLGQGRPRRTRQVHFRHSPPGGIHEPSGGKPALPQPGR